MQPKHAILIEAHQPVLRVYTPLADEIGLSPSILLLQIDFWLNSDSAIFEDGHWWISLSIRDMQKRGLGFWTPTTINRNIGQLERKCLIVSVIPDDPEKPRKIRFNREGIEKLESIQLGGVSKRSTPLQNATPPVAFSNTYRESLKDSLSGAHAHIETSWQAAYEKHVNLATPNDATFFADLLKTHDEADIVYAIVEAAKNDAGIKYHAHRSIQKALDDLIRSREVKVNLEVKIAIKQLIKGAGNDTNITRAAKILDTLEKVELFTAFWKTANPIGKPDEKPHASQVESYMPDALAWHKQKQAQEAEKQPAPKPVEIDCPHCKSPIGNGNGFIFLDDESVAYCECYGKRVAS